MSRSRKKNINQNDEEHPDPPKPPGTPERIPIKEPEEEKKPPLGDPQQPSRKKPRLSRV